ncbi:hypothetical protein D9M69_640400 [compost metagenome]
MEHQRHAHGLERRARELGAVLRGRGRQLGAAHLREADTGALEQRAAFEDAGQAVALQRLAGLFLPGVAHRAAAVRRLDRRDDRLLQSAQIVADRLRLGGWHQDWGVLRAFSAR